MVNLRLDISCKPPINPKLFRCIPAGESTWVFHVTAQHNMLVGNSSNMYNVIISYINSSSWKSNHVSVPFTWPIKMLNLSTLTYFWIVLIGVIISRLTTDYTKLIATTADNKTWMKLYVGIAFSAIIALLIFGNFDQDVPNRGNIIVNISLAFGFGFGFDKALDAGQKFLAN